MSDFYVQSLVKWFHLIFLVLAGGTMPVCLMLSGFEDTHEEVRGIAAGVWKKLAIWGMRFAVLCGVILYAMACVYGEKPYFQPHLIYKLVIVILLVVLCENAPKQLINGKRGYAMLALMLFILTSFIASTRLFQNPDKLPEAATSEALAPPDAAATETAPAAQ